MKKFNQIFIVAACMLLGILLTRQHIPQKTMTQVTKAPSEKKTAYLTFLTKRRQKKMHLKIRMLLNALFIRAMHISLIPEVVQVHWTSLPPMKW